MRATNAKNEVAAQLAYDEGYRARLATQKKENEVLHKRTLEYKSDQHARQREFEARAKQSALSRKPFEAKINETARAEAAQHKARQTAAAHKQKHRDLLPDYGMEDSPGAAETDDRSERGEAEGGLFGDDQGGDDIDAKLREEELA